MKSILITGGTGKIGQVLVKHFAKSGWRVALTSRSAVKPGAGVRAYRCDFLKAGEVKELCEKFDADGFRPDAVIHAARDRESLILSDRAAFVHEFVLNVAVPHELTLGLLRAKNPCLRSVIHVASIYGIVAPNPGLYEDPKAMPPAQYGVAKAALIQLTKELAVRLAPQGVRVNAISYGGVKGRAPKELEKRYAKLNPAGRMLGDADLAAAADFLAGDGSSGVTGHNLVVDGGFTIW